VVEGLALLLEPRFFPLERSVPPPAPVVSAEFPTIRAATEQLRAEHADWGTSVPLAEDPQVGWALAPGATFNSGGVVIRSDERGLRVSDLPSFQRGELRLLSLGDSSVFGVGVPAEGVFLSIAADLLSRSWSRPVAAVNGGVPGHSSEQSLALARQLVPEVQPHWLVVACLWSDVYGKQHEFLAQAGTYFPALRGSLRMLASYRIARRLLVSWLESRKVGWMVSRDDLGSLDGGLPTRVALSSYVQNLRAIGELARQQGSRVIFVQLPAPMDLDRVPPPPTVQRFRAAMASVADELDAPLLDGPELFDRSGATIGFFQDNVHPTNEGHLLLGVGLAHTLLEQAPPAATPPAP